MSHGLGGREQEIAWVHALLADTGNRSGIIVGSPGMGKTALVETALAEGPQERESPAQRPVLRLQGSPVLASMRFGALAPLLGSLSGALDEARVLGALLSSIKPAPHEAGWSSPLLIIDDAQFLDPASSFVLSHLVQSGTLSILLLSTDIRGADGALDAIYDGAQLDTLVLRGLDADAVAEQCRHLLGGVIGAGTVAIIRLVTIGNPLLVSGFVKSARAQGVLVLRAGIWVLTRTRPEPDAGLREMVRGLQQRMPDSLRHALELLSLAGPQDAGTLQAVTGVDPASLGHFGIAAPVDSREVRIASPLYAEVLRSLVPPGRSEQLRQDWVEHRGEPAPRETFSQVLWAVECGEKVPDAELVESAMQANDELAYETAWKLIQDLPPEAKTVELTMQEARALMGMARPHTAYSLLESLLETLRDPADLPPVMALCHLAARQAGESGVELARFHGLWRDKSRQLLEAMPPGPERQAAALRNEIGLKLQKLGMDFGDPRLHPQILERGRELESISGLQPSALIAAKFLQARVLAGQGVLERAIGLYTEAMALTDADPVSFRAQRMEIAIMLALTHIYEGRYSLAIQVVESERSDRPEEILRNHGSWQLILAFAAATEGRFHAARNRLAEATEELAFHDPLRLRPLALGLRVFVSRELGLVGDEGEVDGLDAALAEQEQKPFHEANPFELMTRAWIVDPADPQAPARFEELSALARSLGNRVSEREVGYLAWRGVLATGTDIGEAGRQLVSVAAAVEGSRSRALSLVVEAHRDGTPGRLEETALELHALGETGMAMETLAQAVLLTGTGAGAERSRGVAVRRLSGWLHEQDGRSWGVLTEALAGRELTQREQEIVDLVIAGKSNREIARELTVSQRTVEGHLYRIFAKRGISDRAQLAESE